MVLGPFAETKGPRRRGRNPAFFKTGFPIKDVGNDKREKMNKKRRLIFMGRLFLGSIESSFT